MRRVGGGLLPRPLCSRKWAKIADEQHQFPSLIVSFVVRIATGRHPPEAYAMLNDVVRKTTLSPSRASRGRMSPARGVGEKLMGENAKQAEKATEATTKK